MKRCLLKLFTASALTLSLSMLFLVHPFVSAPLAHAACSGVDINEVLVTDLCETSFPVIANDPALDTIVTNNLSNQTALVRDPTTRTLECTLAPHTSCDIVHLGLRKQIPRAPALTLRVEICLTNGFCLQ